MARLPNSIRAWVLSGGSGLPPHLGQFEHPQARIGQADGRPGEHDQRQGAERDVGDEPVLGGRDGEAVAHLLFKDAAPGKRARPSA